jgi:hypothetical protein
VVPHTPVTHPGLALGGGGGLGHLLVKLFIWHLIWRAGLLIWRVPTVGPGLVALIVLTLVALAIFRARGGRGWPGPRWPGRGRRDPFGDRTSDRGSPRDW